MPFRFQDSRVFGVIVTERTQRVAHQPPRAHGITFQNRSDLAREAVGCMRVLGRAYQCYQIGIFASHYYCIHFGVFSLRVGLFVSFRGLLLSTFIT